MYLDELGFSGVDLEVKEIGDGWVKLVTQKNDRIVILYFQYVDMAIEVPCCGRPMSNNQPDWYCALPAGHQSSDVPCIAGYQEPNAYRRIVKLSDRHPRFDEEIQEWLDAAPSSR